MRYAVKAPFNLCTFVPLYLCTFAPFIIPAKLAFNTIYPQIPANYYLCRAAGCSIASPFGGEESPGNKEHHAS